MKTGAFYKTLSCSVVCLGLFTGCAGLLETENDVSLAPVTVEETQTLVYEDSIETVEEARDNKLALLDAPKVNLSSKEKIGIYHKVRDGQTLWSISKAYGVNMQEIIKSNNIPDVAKVEVNQLIFIPGAKEVIEIYKRPENETNEFVWPLKGKVIRYFQHKKGNVPNNGIHIRAEEGDVVRASRSGKVVFADYLTGYGYTVILDHQDGFHSVYSNNAKLLVKLGQTVYQTNPISHIGRFNNELAYLHFEIRKGSKEDNPLHYLP